MVRLTPGPVTFISLKVLVAANRQRVCAGSADGQGLVNRQLTAGERDGAGDVARRHVEGDRRAHASGVDYRAQRARRHCRCCSRQLLSRRLTTMVAVTTLLRPRSAVAGGALYVEAAVRGRVECRSELQAGVAFSNSNEIVVVDMSRCRSFLNRRAVGNVSDLEVGDFRAIHRVATDHQS